MLEWTKTNTSNVIMIYGDSDPWYFVRLPESDNQNIHIFVSSTNAHDVRIQKMEEDLRTEIKALLTKWLIQDANEKNKNVLRSSGSNCNSGFSFLSFSLLLISLKKIRGSR